MKQVMITLGPKAVEYITGIPEEELPTILSDLIERALTEQVRPITGKADQAVDLVSQLKSILGSVSNGSTSTVGEPPSITKRREVVVEEIDESSIPSLEDCFDAFDLFK